MHRLIRESTVHNIMKELVVVFSEKTDVPTPRIFSFSTAVTLKTRSRSPKSTGNQFFFYVLIIYLCKFGKNPTTGSQDIVQTRKCHANANWIRNKNNIYPTPLVGGKKIYFVNKK